MFSYGAFFIICDTKIHLNSKIQGLQCSFLHHRSTVNFSSCASKKLSFDSKKHLWNSLYYYL